MNSKYTQKQLILYRNVNVVLNYLSSCTSKYSFQVKKDPGLFFLPKCNYSIEIFALNSQLLFST